ncbi:polysaccharide deacetylase family protein [Qipengyuania sp. YG27]|uniref:Polysaccharide deacetylase family protein n=1 Tax=Qipengyuania mesophila TaxID=2867246 RepID=A0ABS7JX29_9SPHN|nr:polysaccharide deacetylase family protein [Qipengyuania mesophila]MBX7502164.1 polysaccharide deacetylase family protein [Qipengyuania mesophila]
MQGSSSKRLLASIHDVGPGSEAAVDRLVATFERHLGGLNFAMLVVPDHWGRHPLAGNAAFARKLRDWSDAGVEMFVHGWFHRDSADHSGVAALKARHMTASEGEFLGLSADEAARRMRDGKSLVEEIIGREAAGFIAPAWLYGQGAMTALRASGFALAEDHLRVWIPETGLTLSRSPVITWASRTRARTASSLAVARLARSTFHPLRDVRLAVHPGDVSKQSIIDSIEATLAAFTARRQAGRYSDLLR